MTGDVNETTGNKALDKLLDCYRKGAGAVPQPLFALFRARAQGRTSMKAADEQAEVIKTLTDELSEEKQLLGYLDFQGGGMMLKSTLRAEPVLPAGAPLEFRAFNRLTYQETRRQYNLEQIMLHAAEDLLGADAPSEAPVDENWCFRFFDIAATACAERMQVIWGQVLARELRQPRTFSFRALEVLKNATAEHFDAIVRAARLRLVHGHLAFIAYPENFVDLEKQFGMSVKHMLLLQEIGAVAHDSNIRFTLPPTRTPETVQIRHGQKLLQLERKEGAPGISVPAIVFTQVGSELATLAGGRENLPYARFLADQARDQCYRMIYADVSLAVGSEILTTNEVEL